MASVTLTAALRSNLLSLQGTQSLLDQTQYRLATGKKVNSALDNATAFFAAQSLTNTAGDLSGLLDNIGQGVQTLKAVDTTISSLTQMVNQAKSIAQTARDIVAGGGTAAAQVAQYDAVRAQIDLLVGDAGYRGIKLLTATAVTYTVKVGLGTTSTLSVTSVDRTANGMNIAAAAFGTTGDIDTAIGQCDTALTTLRNDASTFGNNLTVLQTRFDFTQNLINTLKEGADKLTVADKNEEGANLLALQTTQQLGIQALSLASQANQSVLRLFA